MTKDPIARAAEDIHFNYAVDAEIIRKRWPADGIIYAHLSGSVGGPEMDEWLLLDRDCTYEKAYTMMQRTVDRERPKNKDGEARGL